jgi:phage terminase large subunit-like protein
MVRRLRNPAAFRAALCIDVDGSPRKLADVCDPWQSADFAALDGGWRAVAGHHDVDAAVRRAWLERPRGHSKTSDIAIMVTWALFASRRAIRGVAAAGDADQAALLRVAIEGLRRGNAWLSPILDVQRERVVNRHTGSELAILTSDAPTSYGLTPDFVVADELVHWRSRELWDSLLSSAAKRANRLLLVITNAGFRESWQWETREAIRQDPSWYFSRLEGPRASWIDGKRLGEQRRLLPRVAYQRLWFNAWSLGSGDALSSEDIDAAVARGERREEMEHGWQYFAGLDLGLSRDASALVTVAKHVGWCEVREAAARSLSPHQRTLIEAGLLEAPDMTPEFIEHPGTGRLRLLGCQIWRPESGRKVSIEQIESAIVEASERYDGLRVGFDPYQAMYLAQRLRAKGVNIEAVDFTGSNLKSMCSAVLEAFSEGTIDLYECPQLLADLRSLRVVEKAYGCRLESPRGPGGHGDAATGLAIALHLARQTAEYRPATVNRPLLCYP